MDGREDLSEVVADPVLGDNLQKYFCCRHYDRVHLNYLLKDVKKGLEVIEPDCVV